MTTIRNVDTCGRCGKARHEHDDHVLCAPKPMFDYLKSHDGPVVKGLEQFETVYAKDQPEYIPLRTLPGENGNSAISRFHLTDEQRKAIANGADIYLEILHYRGPLAPSRLMVMSEPSDEASHFVEWWRAQTKGTYPIPNE